MTFTAVASAGARAGFQWQLPPGFPIPYVPPGNPMSQEKVELGERLFFDTRLSSTKNYSCASCHRPDLAFSDGSALAVGATGEKLARSTMSLFNLAYSVGYGWSEPGFTSLETQMHQPLFNQHPIEIGLRGRDTLLIAQLRADKDIARQFSLAFPGSAVPVSIDHLIWAIAAYERTLISGRSAFDRYVFDDDKLALSDSAKHGMALFYSHRLGCSQCHFGLNFSGPVAVAQHPLPRALYADTGTGGRFRVPSLRNIAITAPYMHDGRFADLVSVIDHYQGMAIARSSGAKLDGRLMVFELESQEKQDLIDFLNCLSDLNYPYAGSLH